MRPSQLVQEFGASHAAELGIDLDRADADALFSWFLAAILYGARISGSIAAHTWREFERAGIGSAQQVVGAGWDKLVAVLDSGGYARYDFKTATKLLDVCGALLAHYGGDLNALHERAADEADLERRIRRLGKGIGAVTANIFLRELRGRWPKAKPLPSARVIAAAKSLKLVPARTRDRARVLAALEKAWRADGGKSERFSDFEAALVRYATKAGRQHQPRRQPQQQALDRPQGSSGARA